MTKEIKFAKAMSILLFQMRIEDYEGETKEFTDRILDNEHHIKMMKNIIYLNILEAVNENPKQFNTDDNGDYKYTAPDTYDFAYAVDTYVEEQYELERKARLIIKHKVSLVIERRETDPKDGKEENFPVDNACLGLYGSAEQGRKLLRTIVKFLNDNNM
jgi:hypothetical protein